MEYTAVYFILFTGALCLLVIAVLILLFNDVFLDSGTNYEESVSTPPTWPPQGNHLKNRNISMPMPLHCNITEHEFAPTQDSPYPRNLPPLGFEGILTAQLPEPNQATSSANIRPPYPVNEGVMPQPMSTSSITLSTPRISQMSTSSTTNAPDSETGEMSEERFPPSYEEAVEQRVTSARNRFRRH